MTLGRYGNTGWGTAWITALERLSTAWQNRLPRGKDYAEKGHVMQLQVHAGKITARVQGSRAKPYSTSIEIPPFRESDSERLLLALGERAYYPAFLLAGTMPPGMEEAFRAFSLSLFPARNSEMLGSCNCPDKARPCKHIAAVHYAFAEALESDPFLIWQLRGIERKSLIGAFRRVWFGEEGARAVEASATVAAQEQRGMPVSEMVPDRFNRAMQGIESISFSVKPAEQPLFILQRLAQPPSWRLPMETATLFGPVYEEAVAVAVRLANDVASFTAESGLEVEEWEEEEELDFDDPFLGMEDDDEDDEGDDEDDEGEDEEDDEVTSSARSVAEPDFDDEELPEAVAAPETDEFEEDDSEGTGGSLMAPGESLRSLGPSLSGGAIPAFMPPTGAPGFMSIPSLRPPSVTVRPLVRGPVAQTLPTSLPTVQKRPGRGLTEPAEVRAEAPRREPAVLIRRGPSAPAPSVVSKGGAAAGPSVVRRGEVAGSVESRICRALASGEARLGWDAACQAWRGAATEERLALLLEAAEAAGQMGAVAAETELALAGLIQRGDTPDVALLLALLLAGRHATAAELVHSLGLDGWQGEPSMAAALVTYTVATAAQRQARLPHRSALELEQLWSRKPRLPAELGRAPRSWGYWIEQGHKLAPATGDAAARLVEVSADQVVALALRGGRSELQVARVRGLALSVAQMLQTREGQTSAENFLSECGLRDVMRAVLAPKDGADQGPRRRSKP